MIARSNGATGGDLRGNAACTGAADRAEVIAFGDIAVGDIACNAAGVIVVARGHIACVKATRNARFCRGIAVHLSADTADIGRAAAHGSIACAVFNRCRFEIADNTADIALALHAAAHDHSAHKRTFSEITEQTDIVTFTDN